MWKKKCEADDCSAPFAFARVKILVVDECSLVAVQLIARLLTIMTEQCDLEKVILLGDLLQLPSIQPGEALRLLQYLFLY